MKKFICFSVVLILLPGFAQARSSRKLNISKKLWASAVERLKQRVNNSQSNQDIFQKKHIEWIEAENLEFQGPAVRLKMLNHVMPAPHKRVLDSFTNRTSIRRVKKFMSKNEKAFIKAWKNDGVPSSVVAGLLLIETGYNNPNIKYFRTLDTLVSLAIMADKEVQTELLPKLRKQAKKYDLPHKWKQKWAWTERSKDVGDKWFIEVREFLNLAVLLKWEEDFAKKVEGSWAGAIGFSQFMPSTARKRLGKRQFDLWNWDDSISFTSEELSHSGWKNNPDRALMKYNRVDWYRRTVIAIHIKVWRWWEEGRSSQLYGKHGPI